MPWQPKTSRPVTLVPGLFCYLSLRPLNGARVSFYAQQEYCQCSSTDNSLLLDCQIMLGDQGGQPFDCHKLAVIPEMLTASCNFRHDDNQFCEPSLERANWAR